MEQVHLGHREGMLRFDFEVHCAAYASELLSWRKSGVPKRHYPKLVVESFFIPLCALEHCWTTIHTCFTGQKQYQDLQASLNGAFSKLQLQQEMAQLAPQVSDLLRPGVVKGGVQYDYFHGLLSRAEQGDNAAVEEIEFCANVYGTLPKLFISWCALGLFGLGNIEAYLNIVCLVTRSCYRGGLGTFDSVCEAFKASAAAHVGGCDQLPQAYRQLPPLW